jgi:predicted RNase H-like HicB family nuclease
MTIAEASEAAKIAWDVYVASPTEDNRDEWSLACEELDCYLHI